jgi:hypothetical protein
MLEFISGEEKVNDKRYNVGGQVKRESLLHMHVSIKSIIVFCLLVIGIIVSMRYYVEFRRLQMNAIPLV